MKYDAVIIGSGQAGNPLSLRLADLGWKVALVEKANLGGTCINTGCTPTKTMVHRAQIAHYAKNAARWGVNAQNVSVNLPVVVAEKDKVVQGFRDGIEERADQRQNLRLYRGTARFVSSRQIRVSLAGGGDELLESDKIFINTGARARIPPTPGLDKIRYLTNESVMQLTEVPEHLIILGGGFIGLEFGQMFRRFGSRVTIIHNGGHIAAREEPEVSSELQNVLEGEGIAFHFNVKAVHVEEKGGSMVVHFDDPAGPGPISGSHFLVATGRQPNTEDLDLAKAGVETDQFGYVKVNHRLETNVPGIWALGDVKGGPAFTHISFNDFQIVDANLTRGQNLSTENRLVPYCVFTDPQLASVGLKEAEARAKGYKLKIGKVAMSQVARAIERDETSGSMKVVIDAENDRILGATILAVEGGELIHVLYTLMLGKLPYTLLKGAVYIHPTLCEGFFALLESVKLAD